MVERQGIKEREGVDVGYREVAVNYSYAELKQVMTSIDVVNPWATVSEGLRISVGINATVGTVDVGVSKVTPELRGAAAAAFGDAVRVIPDEILHLL